MASWLQNHLDTFVYPTLGYVPKYDPGIKVFTPTEMRRIKSVWSSVKRQSKGKQLVLGGRDTFIFEVLARRENFPTLYLPKLSRVTVGHIQIPDKENSILFDTGFAGSIPKKLGMKHLLLSHDIGDPAIQIFPGLKMSRELAYKIEYSPKYWESARTVYGKVLQQISSLPEFIRAFRLTVEIYKDSTPMKEVYRDRQAYSFSSLKNQASFAEIFGQPN
jgi:hypothetical protein